MAATLSIRHHAFGRGAGGKDPGQPTSDAKAQMPGVVAETETPPRAKAVAVVTQHAAAANGDACGQALRALLATRAEQLSSGADARDRLAGVILGVGNDFPGYQRAFDRELELAVAQHPDDTLLRWLHATRCLESEKCNEAAILESLRQLDPGNSAPYLLALDAAMKRDDLARAEVLLAEAARQARVDVYWGRLPKHIVEVVGPAGDVPACDRAAAGNPHDLDVPRTLQENVEVFAGAIGAAQAIPLGVLRLCPLSGIPQARLPACRAMFAQMAANDTLLLHAIGAKGMLKNASTPAERAHWGEVVRNVEWMKREGPPLLRTARQSLVWEHGEVPVLIALLEGEGRWPAPKDWQPDVPVH